jgi:PAS domain S-box-containing protein
MSLDPADTLSLLDNSMFLPFDGTMAMSLDPTGPLPQSFTAGPAQPPSSTAQMGSAEPAAFSPAESTSTSSGAANPPRESLSSGNSSNPSALTEFTKRRNWPARVIEELQDLLHILDANGRIKHVSPSAEHLTGYKPAELRDLLMRDLLHPDDVGVFTSELNESIASGSQLRVFYRMRKKDGQYAVFEAVGHAHIAAAKFAPNPNNQTPFCQAVFLMARPYPTKNAALLDSFLEHKMENERLKRKIAELQREEQDEAEESERTWQQQQQQQTQEPPFQPLTDPSGLPPRERRVSIDSSSGPNDSPTSTRRPSLSTSTPTHADTIEMLTGLRYHEGERSRGLTTGNPSPALITGDAGIAIPVDKDPRTGEKKKKLKVAEEYVCTDCGKFLHQSFSFEE